MSRHEIYYSREEIRKLSKRSDIWGYYLVAHCWGVIVTAMIVFATWPNPITFVFCVMIVGSRQLGMAILMHEAAHRTLFRSKTINDFVGHYLLALPFGGNLHSYRKYHLTHHRHTQQDDDPDLILSAPFPVTKASLSRKLFRDLSGQTALKQRVGQFIVAVKGDASAQRDIRGFVFSQILILGVCTAFGVWWLYFACYLLPLFTWFQAVLRVRNIAEHACVSREENPLTNARTTYANLIERALVAPYWVNFHVEHHAFMFVPCYRLKTAHKNLLAKGYGEKMTRETGYISILKLASAA